jgi:hypothetical protein
MSSLSVAEVVQLLKSAKTKNDRTEILKSHDSPALRGILRMNYDTSLVLALPDGKPPYKPLAVPQGFGQTTLKVSAKGWYVFSKENAPNLRQSKRESMFISLLEALDPVEAEILLAAKDRKLDLGLTKKAIDEVFPGLIKSEGKTNGKKEQSAKAATNTAASATESDGKTARADIDI